MTATMRAVVLDAPGPPEALRIRELPLPEPRLGWVLIRVKAFGINRSELHTRLGLAQGVTFPRVLGIEAAGVVAAAPGGEFEEGQQVAAMMGCMGRTFDGGYAEFTSVPATQVISFRSELDWTTLGRKRSSGRCSRSREHAASSMPSKSQTTPSSGSPDRCSRTIATAWSRHADAFTSATSTSTGKAPEHSRAFIPSAVST